jgi:cellobiose-specific phosphotransferase system component IIA
MNSKEEIAKSVISKLRKGTYEDWVNNIKEAMDEHASAEVTRKFGELVGFMEMKAGTYRSSSQAFKELSRCIQKAKEIQQSLTQKTENNEQ